MFHVVDFSVELPMIIMEVPVSWLRPSVILGRSYDLALIADEMAKFNAGRFYREIINASDVYHDYLADLFRVEGLESVRKSARYRIELSVGLCFEADEVCRDVARVLQRHFYSDAELSIESRLSENPTRPGDAHVHV